MIVFVCRDGAALTFPEDHREVWVVSLTEVADPQAAAHRYAGVVNLRFPELGTAQLLQHLDVFVCGLLQKRSVPMEEYCPLVTGVVCPACEVPLVPYEGCLVCPIGHIVVKADVEWWEDLTKHLQRIPLASYVVLLEDEPPLHAPLARSQRAQNRVAIVKEILERLTTTKESQL